MIPHRDGRKETEHEQVADKNRDESKKLPAPPMSWRGGGGGTASSSSSRCFVLVVSTKERRPPRRDHVGGRGRDVALPLVDVRAGGSHGWSMPGTVIMEGEEE